MMFIIGLLTGSGMMMAYYETTLVGKAIGFLLLGMALFSVLNWNKIKSSVSQSSGVSGEVG